MFKRKVRPRKNPIKILRPRNASRPGRIQPLNNTTRVTSSHRSKSPTNSSRASASEIDHSFTLSLEQVVLIEEQLWMTLEGLRNAVDVSPYVLTYWDLTTDETVTKITRIFRDERCRKIL